jgi:hypothetical protein
MLNARRDRAAIHAENAMADSTLLHEGSTPPKVLEGHGTAALGPSDSSDSGSDIQGGPGLNGDDGLFEPPGTTSDPDFDGAGATAGPDIGDANLDSDSDRYGTGERAAAGRDSTLPTDTILRDERDNPIDPESILNDEDSPGATRDDGVGTDVEREDIESDRADADLADVSGSRSVQRDVEREKPSGASRDR